MTGTFTLDSPTREIKTPHIDPHTPSPKRKVEMAFREYQKSREECGNYGYGDQTIQPRAQPDTLEATIDDIADAQEVKALYYTLVLTCA